MPKAILKKEKFEGGLNNNADPRDIQEDELSSAVNLMVDQTGIIRLMGGLTSAHTNFNTSATRAGYGLFQFSSDYTKASDNTTSAVLGATNYIAIWDNDSTVDIWDETNLGTGQISLGTGGGDPCFYYADGALRVSDGSMSANNESVWYGVTDRKYFGGEAYEDILKWSQSTQIPAPPTAGKLKLHSGGSLWGTSGSDPTVHDGFLSLSISGNSAEEMSSWISLLNYNSNIGGDGIYTESWHAKHGGIQNVEDRSEFLDSNMEHSARDTGVSSPYLNSQFDIIGNGEDYFRNSTWDGVGGTTIGAQYIDTNVGGTDIIVKIASSEGACTPSAPAGYDTDILSMMRLIKREGVDYCRYSIEMNTAQDMEKKSLFFDLYISEYMATILDYFYVFIGTNIGNIDSTTSSTNWKSYKISGSEVVGGKSDWQTIEINTEDIPYDEHGSFSWTAIKAFGIQMVTYGNDDFGTDARELASGYVQSSVYTCQADCLIYNIRIGDPARAGSWNGKYRFAYTWLYDDTKQESYLFELLDHTTNAHVNYDFTGTSLYIRAHAKQSNASGNPLGFNHATAGNSRIVGANIYYFPVNQQGEDEITDPYLLMEVDFEQGVRAERDGSWSVWSNDGSHASALGAWEAPGLATNTDSKPLLIELPPFLDTFSLVAGYELPDTIKHDSLYYKTAVVANRMTYIGNVKYEILESGKIHTKADALLKSNVNRLDSFSANRRIEVTIQDGDEIVKLDEYADRLLQFKKTKLHIINISQEIEFLEDTFMHKGVSNPAATCKTDYGIAWVNKHGAYLYDGDDVTNLLERGGRQIIKESEWTSFIADDSKCSIGYLPQKRQLIVSNDFTASSLGNIYLYDMVTQSWVKGTSKLPGIVPSTNFITDWNGDLIHAHRQYNSSTINVKKWDDVSDSNQVLEMIIKDEDFGEPAQRKKIYKVYITYKGTSATNVTVDYDVNGGTTFPYDFADGTNFVSQKLSGSSSWAVAELKPDTSSEANNIKSFQLRFQDSGTGYEVTKVECVADSSDSLNAKYFDLYGAGGKTEVWIDTDNSGTSQPSGSGSYVQNIEVTEVETNDTANSVAIAVAAAVDDHADFSCEVQGSTVYITDSVVAIRVNASDGDTGFTITEEKAGGTSVVPANFAINDISVVYRLKRVK